MIGRKTRMRLRHYLERGISKSALAWQLGISRDTATCANTRPTGYAASRS